MIRRVAAAVGALLLSAGCAAPAAPPQPSLAPEADPRARSQFTVVWADAAGLDLQSAEGTFLRASVESLRFAAGNRRRDAAYPGFWETLAGPARTYADGFYELGPDDALHGVARFEIVTFTGNDQRFDAGVCIFERQLGVERDGRFVFARQGSHYWKLTVDRSGVVSPPADQSGAESRPLTAVFGSWRTLEWARPASGETDPCQDRPTPGVEPGAWPALMPGSQSYATEAVPEAPNFPGWPSNVT